MLIFCVAVFVLVSLPHGARATDCKDAAVVVVASVFATLAVVFLVLGIVGFLIWKRRRDISRPEKLKNDTSGSSPSSTGNGKYGYNNPAFDKDPEMGDSGVPGYVQCKDQMSDKRKEDELDGDPFIEPKSLTDNEMAKKTWSSLPGSDLPYGRSRKSSTGSLDGDNYPTEDSIVEVWLTSQDFIGLGFNIAGSMRDGIYVSQVHNRGPAKESGTFKVGDRIMSVAISFENMVYEDALTILSYASPYPVKVTLQKQQQMPKHRRLSEVRTNLNHPLYRSHSLDAVNIFPRESIPSFHAKRSASEMRYDRRNSPKTTHASKGGSESDIIEENNASSTDDVFHKNVPIPKGNDFVQRRKSDKDRLAFDREISVPTETDLPLASVDLNINEQRKESEKGDATNPSFTDAFEHLTEEDKLAMLRLTYDDPNQVIDRPFEVQKQVVEAEINHQVVNADLKSAPVKPERKKKCSSSNSTPSHSDADISDSNMSSPRLDKNNSVDDEALVCPTEAPPPLPDDVFEITLAPPTEAPPPLPDNIDVSNTRAPSDPPPPVPDNEFEAEEDLILPQQKGRDVLVNSQAIVFESVTPTKHDVSDVSIDRTVVGDASFSDHSFTDVDTTLVNSPTGRPESPDGDEVEEEQISATQLKRGDLSFNSPNVFVQGDVGTISNDIRERKVSSSSDSSKSENDNIEQNGDGKIGAGVEESVQQSDDDFEKDLPKLDMNLNFDTFGSDSVLFKETFPNRHERENDGGLAYDISVTELESMEQKFRDQERVKNQNQIGKGGIAFEIRDDLESGNTRTVSTNSVHRTSSYEFQSTSDLFITREISTHRPTSLKGDIKRREDVEGGVLDWSGKRLVRSGSFTEIPQDDSVKDWTDDQTLSEDDSLIEKHIEEDANSPVLKPLTRATQFQSNQTNDNLSDSDSQCRSLSSPSSSGSNSPNHLENYHGTNGEDDGLGMSPDNSPIKITPTADIKSELKSSVSKYGENDQAFTVTLNTTEDEDC